MIRKEWQKEEKHHKDIDDVYQKLGFYDSRKVTVIHFDGKLFFPEIEKLGHDKAEYEICKCHIVNIRNEPASLNGHIRRSEDEHSASILYEESKRPKSDMGQ